MAPLRLLVVLCLCVGLARAELPEAREADTVLDTLAVVIDAPWRVQRRPGRATEVPVLFFFPEVREGWRRVRVQSIGLYDCEREVDVPLFEQRAGYPPVWGSSPGNLTGQGVRVQDAWGRIAPDTTVVVTGQPAGPWQVGEVNDENRGFHVMLRLPIPEAPAGRKLALAGRATIQRLDDAGKAVGAPHTVRRRLEIDIDPEPLPMFEGWRSFDTHVHTLAEFDEDTSFRALRKNYGGPLRMVVETLAGLGMVDDPDHPEGRVLTTDHNCYFGDDDFPRVGPTVEGLFKGPVQVLHPEWKPYFSVAAGQREFENYHNILGASRGEELSLAKEPGGVYGPVGALAAHMIVHGGRHFDGPFHGGKFIFWRDENPNPVERVLPDLANNAHFRQPFAYAAHPFTESATEKRFGTYWNDEQLGFATRGHVTWSRDGKPQDHVFRGFQLWNQRDDRLFSMALNNRERMAKALEDPRREPEWAAGNPNWDHVLNFGLERWHQILCDGFAHAAPTAPAVKTIRKLYIAGGSDAHGDFNRYSDCAGRGFSVLPFPLDRLVKGFTIGSNALARVRLAVDATPQAGRSADEQALWAYAHGNSCVTDGPALELEVDADGHFDQQRMAWSSEPVFREADGRMGGDGRLDGGRTALVPAGAAPVLRWRWKNTAQFGGALERLELYRDEPGKSVERVQVTRNTGPAWVLKPDAVLDVAGRADAGGWRSEVMQGTAGLRPVATPTALSLGGFTARPPKPPYEFRAYTNPVWLLPVSAGLAVDGPLSGGKGDLRATVRFPISMEERALAVSLIPLDAQGVALSAGVELRPAPKAWTSSPRETVASCVYTVVSGAPVALSAAREWLLVVRDPCDAQGNVLNTIAFKLPAPGVH